MVIKHLIIVLFLFLSSCVIGPVKELKQQIEDEWSDDAPRNPSPLVELPNHFESKLIWQVDLGNNILPSQHVSSCSDKVFASNADSEVLAIDKNNGQILWTVVLDSNVSTGISCDEKNIYFGANDGFAISMNHEGKLLWKNLIGLVNTPPLVVNDSVIFKTVDFLFFSLKTVNGFKNWSYQSPTPPLTIKSWGGLNYSEGIIYSGLPSGKCVAINLETGELIWETTYSQPKGTSDIERANDSTSKPVFDDSFLYIISSHGNLVALDKKNGLEIWSRKLSSFYGISIFNENIIVIHNSSALYSISKDTSKVLWRNSDYIERDLKEIIIFDKYILVGDFNGYIHFIDHSSGKSFSRFKVSSDAINQIYIDKSNNNILWLDKAGELAMIQIRNTNISIKEKNNSEDLAIDLQDNQKENEKSLIDDLIFWD